MVYYKVDSGWKPGANTLVYYDFENDTGTTLKNSASSGTIYDGTFNSTPSYGTTTAGKKYFICNATNYATTPVIPFNYGNVTFNMRMDFSSSGTFDFGTGWWSYAQPNVAIYNIDTTYYFTANNSPEYTNNSISDGWHLITMTSDGSDTKFYIDGVLVETKSSHTTSKTNTYNIGIGTVYEQKQQTPFGGNYGAVIIEDKVRTAQEIADYYDLTKGDYGIS